MLKLLPLGHNLLQLSELRVYHGDLLLEVPIVTGMTLCTV